ncbi:hypothetical protein OQA88_254 [Cercophora sp. LCS_1]
MQLPRSPVSLILLFSAAVPSTIAAQLTDHSKCSCYLTNGTESRFFSHHAFYDFRSQSQYAGVSSVITTKDETPGAPPTSKYFTSEKWSKWWILGNWNNSHNNRADATVYMSHSPNNVYIEANPDKSPNAPQTWLTLRTSRLKDTKDSKEFQTSAEIESFSPGFRFVSVRMLARTIGAKGAVTALFTYKDSNKRAEVQESDMEVRTSDAEDIIHYTNQPSLDDEGDVITQATLNATLSDGLKWTDWAVHRMDWTPTRNTWFVNGKQVAQISFQTPRDASKIILNAWSDGGQWSGNMSVGEAAYLQVQWFEVVYNSTEKVEHVHRRREEETNGRGAHGEFGDEAAEGTDAAVPRLEGRAEDVCLRVCSIDETPTLGTPVMLWDNGVGKRWEMGSTGWIPLVVMVVMVKRSAGAWR